MSPNWQPINGLPMVAHLVDEGWANAQEHFETLRDVRCKPHVLDDATVARILAVFGEDVSFFDIYEQQLERWQRNPLSDAQAREVARLLEVVTKTRPVAAILALAEEIRKGMIDAVLRMSDMDVGLCCGAVAMPPTEEQIRLASSIDAQIQTLTRQGVTEPLAVVGAMADAMPSFRRILDTATPEVLDEIGQRFVGFHRYAKVLEWLAAKLQSGEIVAP
jgi:hypothetical protein